MYNSLKHFSVTDLTVYLWMQADAPVTL